MLFRSVVIVGGPWTLPHARGVNMIRRWFVYLTLWLITPLVPIYAQSDHVARTCVTAREGLWTSIPPNSTKQAIWSRDQLVAYLNSRKVSSKDHAKVVALPLTTMSAEAVTKDAVSLGCDYLVIVDLGVNPISPQGAGVPAIEPLRPDNAAEQLAPRATGFCLVHQLPGGKLLDGCRAPCGSCVHQVIEDALKPNKTP